MRKMRVYICEYMYSWALANCEAMYAHTITLDSVRFEMPFSLIFFSLKIWIPLKKWCHIETVAKTFLLYFFISQLYLYLVKIYFDSKKIFSFIWNFELSVRILVCVCDHSFELHGAQFIVGVVTRIQICVFPLRGFDRSWVKRRSIHFSRGRARVHRVSVIGGCALRRMRCASGAYLRITLRTASPDEVLCTDLSTVNRLTVVPES